MKKSKKCKVVYETHTRELSMGTNNKPIHNPFLSESEKSFVPYEESDGEVEATYFDTGELSTFRKIGLLTTLLRKEKIHYEYDLEDEVFEVLIADNKHVEGTPYYIYVQDNAYVVAIYTMEYVEKFSGNLNELKHFIHANAFVKRHLVK